MRHFSTAQRYLENEAARADEQYVIRRGELVSAIRAGLSTRAFEYLLNTKRINLACSNILDRVEAFVDQQQH